MTKINQKSGFLTLILSVTSASSLMAADSPISLSGFNQDVVVEASAPADQEPGNYASGFDVKNNMAFYEQGLATISSSYPTDGGLPVGGSINSLFGGVTYQLQPYTQNNVLLLTQDNTTQTLTFNNPAAYSSLSILATSANSDGSAQGTFTINFTDLTSSGPISYDAFDWFSGGSTAGVNSIGRVYLGYGAVYGDGSDQNGNPSIYQTDVDLSNLGLDGKAIASVTFTMPYAGDSNFVDEDTGIFAISGTPVVAVPEPSYLALAGLGIAGLMAIRRRR